MTSNLNGRCRSAPDVTDVYEFWPGLFIALPCEERKGNVFVSPLVIDGRASPGKHYRWPMTDHVVRFLGGVGLVDGWVPARGGDGMVDGMLGILWASMTDGCDSGGFSAVQYCVGVFCRLRLNRTTLAYCFWSKSRVGWGKEWCRLSLSLSLFWTSCTAPISSTRERERALGDKFCWHGMHVVLPAVSFPLGPALPRFIFFPSTSTPRSVLLRVRRVCVCVCVSLV